MLRGMGLGIVRLREEGTLPVFISVRGKGILRYEG